MTIGNFLLIFVGIKNYRDKQNGGIVTFGKAFLLGFMISFAGNVTFKKAENLRDSAKVVPLDKLLIETDCPFLTPVPFRGKRNEPSFVERNNFCRIA